MNKIIARQFALVLRAINIRPRILGFLLLPMLAAQPVMGQKDKNYYTQVVRLTDGTEIRLLPDEIGRMSVIKDNDYGQMTVGEYLLYSPLKLDSAYASVGIDTNNENQTYSMWVPTNEAWTASMTAMRPYFFTPERVAALDIDHMYSSSNKVALYRNGGPNNTYAYGALASIFKTTPAPGDAVATQQVLNGTVTVTADEVPRSYWLHELATGDWTTTPMKVFTATDSIATAPGGEQYAMFYPPTPYSKPDVFVTLPKTLSTTYDFYCVLVPENADVCDTVTTARPNILNFELYYGDADGNLQTYKFASGVEYETKNFKDAFTNSPAAIDTLYLGRFTFPVAYEEMGYYHQDEIAPVMHISSPISVFNKTQMAAYTRTVRLSAIIMRPVNLQND